MGMRKRNVRVLSKALALALSFSMLGMTTAGAVEAATDVAQAVGITQAGGAAVTDPVKIAQGQTGEVAVNAAGAEGGSVQIVDGQTAVTDVVPDSAQGISTPEQAEEDVGDGDVATDSSAVEDGAASVPGEDDQNGGSASADGAIDENSSNSAQSNDVPEQGEGSVGDGDVAANDGVVVDVAGSADADPAQTNPEDVPMLFSVAPPAVCSGGSHDYGADGVCTVCGAKNETGVSGCSHNWDSKDGVCPECKGVCDHDGATSGICETCGKVLTAQATNCEHGNDPAECQQCKEKNCTNSGSHGSLHVGETCSDCGYAGAVKYAEGDCPDSGSHSGLAAGESCPKCDYTKPAAVDPDNCADKANHASLHVGETCSICGFAGTLKYEAANCPDASSHSGLAAGESCPKCDYTKPATPPVVDDPVVDEPSAPERPSRPSSDSASKDDSTAKDPATEPEPVAPIETVEPTVEEAKQCDAIVEVLQQAVKAIQTQEVSAIVGEASTVSLGELGLSQSDGWTVNETKVSDPSALIVDSVNPETLEVAYTPLKSGVTVDLTIDLANVTLQKFSGYEDFARTQITIQIVIK